MTVQNLLSEIIEMLGADEIKMTDYVEVEIETKEDYCISGNAHMLLKSIDVLGNSKLVIKY